MAGRPSLEDLLKDIPPEKLNQPCRDDHLSEIALSITDWQSIAPFLGLTEAEIEEIEGDRAKTRPQKIAMLWKWRNRSGRKATYRKLVKVFWKLKRADLVEEVHELLLTASSSSSSEEDGPTDDLSAAKRSQGKSPGSYAKHFGRGHVTEQSEVVEIFEPTIAIDSISSHAKKNVEKNCGETRKTGAFRKVWKKLFGKKKSGKTEKRISLDSDAVCPPAAKRTQKGALDSDADCPPAAKRTQKGALDSDADCLPAAKRTQKGALDSYADYLRGRYSTELPAFFTLQWPPPPTRKVFNLAMIGHQTIQRCLIDEELVQLTLRGNVDDIMRRKSSIELKNLFKLDDIKRKIILIEGAPGAGKSTLAWHIVQKWESGELFQEFKVVVFVQLRDPAIQSAKSLADLLPARSSNMRVELQSNMEACDGRGVLFVFDGWDEYGPGLQPHSLFQQLICRPGEVNMHFSSLIITSRPIASGELQRYASSRVEIVGFTSAEVKKYFSECIRDSEQELKGESETVQKISRPPEGASSHRS